MKRRSWIGGSLAIAVVSALTSWSFAQSDVSGRNTALKEKAAAAAEKGLTFLASAQKKDGCWSSPDYPGLSGLVVQAFLTAPSGKHRDSKAVKDGLKFIRGSAKPDGGIYSKGLGNYNTAIALSTLVRANEPSDRPLIEAARKFLIGGQTKNSATAASDGGFGYDAGKTGRMSRPDLSNTSYALEALALAREATGATERPGEADLDWKAAIDFVSRCQNLASTNKEKWVSDKPEDKGGFTYLPGEGEQGTRSYGTMTYAGLLSLIHANVKSDDERVKAAIEWLSRHYSVNENPGQGEQGLYFYYFVMAKGLSAAGISELPRQTGAPANWRKDLTEKLLQLQKPDGSWVNTNERWMEKDPVLVTAYVVLALNILAQDK
jgi:squalene-hopene/tetraprenyl-beta-curcumene cyclase